MNNERLEVLKKHDKELSNTLLEYQDISEYHLSLAETMTYDLNEYYKYEPMEVFSSEISVLEDHLEKLRQDSKTEEIRKLFETGTEKEILQYLDIFKTPELIEIPQESLSKKVILKLIEINPDLENQDKNYIRSLWTNPNEQDMNKSIALMADLVLNEYKNYINSPNTFFEKSYNLQMFPTYIAEENKNCAQILFEVNQNAAMNYFPANSDCFKEFAQRILEKEKINLEFSESSFNIEFIDEDKYKVFKEILKESNIENLDLTKLPLSKEMKLNPEKLKKEFDLENKDSLISIIKEKVNKYEIADKIDFSCKNKEDMTYLFENIKDIDFSKQKIRENIRQLEN